MPDLVESEAAMAPYKRRRENTTFEPLPFVVPDVSNNDDAVKPSVSLIVPTSVQVDIMPQQTMM